MSQSWLRVVTFVAVVVFGLPTTGAHTIVHAEDGIVADGAALEVSAVFLLGVAGVPERAVEINASASSATACRWESHICPAPDPGGLDGGDVVLTEDDSSDGDEYALPEALAGIGRYLGAASEITAWPEQLPESHAPAPPEDPPAA